MFTPRCLVSELNISRQGTVLYEEQLYLLEEVNGKDPFQTSPRQKYMWCTNMRQKRELQKMVKEEDVPARSSQDTVRALRGEYASVTQKLCRDEHTGRGVNHSRTNNALCISV